MPFDHPLAEHDSVSIEVLADYGTRIGSDTGRVSPVWENAWVPFETPSGRTIHRVAAFSNMEEQLAVLETGESLVLLSAHAARYHARPGIVFAPIHDAQPLPWGLVWRERDQNPALRGLVEVARELGTMTG